MTQTLESNQAQPAAEPSVPVVPLSKNAFVGRAWILDEIGKWLDQGYPAPWLITAEPGWGKSRLAREISKREVGTLLWSGATADADRRKQPWGQVEIERANLIVVDGLNLASSGLELSDWLDRQAFPCPVLILARPSGGFARAAADGLRVTHEETSSTGNLSDLSERLLSYPQDLAQQALARGYGNFLVAGLLAEQTPEADIVEVLWNVALGVVRSAPAEAQIDLFKMLCLLAEAGEPLETEQFVDFLALTAARTQELLSYLRPLLAPTRQHQLYNPWVARAISIRLLRDMEGTHASVIAFFRETYPSWEEMSDPYGWQHLGHHCDRYARTGKKRDFSILHWLTEGPYIRIKLLKTRALVSTLQDVRRGLEAALEEGDLPRIVSYGFMLPRMRREMGASFLHELADKGELQAASSHVSLLVWESSRFLANLLLAWQAADEGQKEWAERYLTAALFTPLPELEADDLPLVTCICASLLKSMPEKEEEIFRLLDLEENPLRASRNYLTLGLVDSLEERHREHALTLGRTRTRLLHSSEQYKLSVFLERSLEFEKKLSHRREGTSADDPLDEDTFVSSITALSKEKQEHQAVDALSQLVESALALAPRPDWLLQRLPLAVQLMGQIKTPAERARGLTMLSRLLIYLGGEDAALEVIENLAHVANEIEDDVQRCRATAEVAVTFHRVGQFVRSNQLISQAASSAFRLEAHQKAGVLKYIAGAAGLVGNHPRAIDLAYNALQTIETGQSYFEVHCRGALKQGVLANISNERSLEMLQFYAENCRLHEKDPKTKALSLSAVAEGAQRLGYSIEARQWLEVAVTIARSSEVAMERSFLLARMAASEHTLGDRARYERLLQESMEALLQESDPLHRSEGLMTLVEVRHQARDPRAQAVERTLVRELSSLKPYDLLHSRTLLRVAMAKQKGDLSADLTELLETARGVIATLSPSERDASLAQQVRLELALEHGEQALALAIQINSTRRKSEALADICEGVIVDHPEIAIRWLSQIPLRSDRLAAILRCGTRLAGELRPSRQKGLIPTLARLTILATEDEAVVDVLLSRWIQLTTDPRLLERTARKMNWIADEQNHAQSVTLRQLT